MNNPYYESGDAPMKEATPLLYRAKDRFEALRVFAGAAAANGGWAPIALRSLLGQTDSHPLTAIAVAACGATASRLDIRRWIERANESALAEHVRRGDPWTNEPGPAPIDIIEADDHFIAAYGTGRTRVELSMGPGRPVVRICGIIPWGEDADDVKQSMEHRARRSGVRFVPEVGDNEANWDYIQELMERTR